MSAAAELNRRFPSWLEPTERVECQTALSTAQAAMGTEAFATAWSTGQAASAQQAIDDARTMLHAR
jgi:hypothetical protein